MNIGTWLDSPACIRLVETLGHFVWQGAAVALLVFFAGLGLRRASPNTRYVVWVAALAVMAACPLVTFALIHTSQISVAIPSAQAVPAPLAAELSLAETAAAQTPSATAAPGLPPVTKAPASAPAISWERYAPYAALIYAVGVLAMLGRLLWAVRGGQRLRRRSQPVDDPALLGAVARQAKALGLSVSPAIAYCEKVLVPTVVGVFRPMILVPAALISELRPDQVELLIAHELSHIRRYDHVVNIIQRVIEAVLFFHPAVWFVSRRIRFERELGCDEMAVAASGQRATYAAGLVRVAELCASGARSGGLASAAALGAGDRPSTLRLRILRLLEGTPQPPVRLRRTWIVVVGMAIAAGFVTAPYLQGAPEMEATVASDEPASFTATLPGGITVELVGVSKIPSEGTRWWRPDGSPLPDPPWPSPGPHVLSDEQVQGYEFVARVTGGQDRDVSVRWAFPAATGTATGLPQGASPDTALEFAAAAIPRADVATTVRLGVSRGPWETLVSSTGGVSYGLDKMSLLFTEPYQTDYGLGITVAHSALEQEHRIVAVDSTGQEHVAAQTNSSGAGDLHQTTVRFPDLKPNEVAAFRFQVRPIEWAEFRNVSLKPGYRTDVQMFVNPGRLGAPQVTAGTGTASTVPVWSHRSPEDEQDRTAVSTDTDDPRLARANALLTVIQETVAPYSWRENGGDASVLEIDGRLVVTQSASNHRAVAGLLTQLVGRDVVGVPTAGTTVSQEQTRLLAKLDEPVSADFNNVAFEDVIHSWSKLGINVVVIWSDLQAYLIKRDTPVTLHLVSKFPLRRVVTEVLDVVGGREVELGFQADDGILRIATRDFLDNDLYTAVYDVHELLAGDEAESLATDAAARAGNTR